MSAPHAAPRRPAPSTRTPDGRGVPPPTDDALTPRTLLACAATLALAGAFLLPPLLPSAREPRPAPPGDETGTAAPPTAREGMPANRIVTGPDGRRRIRVAGRLVSIDPAGRGAVIAYAASGERCAVRLDAPPPASLEPGTAVEAVGEVVENDNLGPLKIRAPRLVRAEARAGGAPR